MSSRNCASHSLRAAVGSASCCAAMARVVERGVELLAGALHHQRVVAVDAEVALVLGVQQTHAAIGRAMPTSMPLVVSSAGSTAV